MNKVTLALVAAITSLTALLLALPSSSASPVAGIPSPSLPDLQMARLGNIHLQVEGAQRQLRFDTIVVNLGSGPLEALGSRASTSEPMGVTQRIYDDEGGFEDVATPATMFFAGDGHAHWHVEDFETYTLRRAGARVATSQKSGYCFFDNVNFRPFDGLPGPVYLQEDVCGVGQPEALATTSGISVGWGDLYASTLPDQYIDVTGLKPGIYRLVAMADSAEEFTESDETNNKTWVRLEIRRGRVTVWSWGPSA